MDASELGRQLRSWRVTTGRTVASVAGEAGLSVPYIANLENGRGNPTLAALQSWAGALGARLDIVLRRNKEEGAPAPPVELPASLLRFSRTERFGRETDSLAAATGRHPDLERERVLRAMVAVAEAAERDLSDLDWHRILDTIGLIAREDYRLC